MSLEHDPPKITKSVKYEDRFKETENLEVGDMAGTFAPEFMPPKSNARKIAKPLSDQICAWLTEMVEAPVDIANQFRQAFPPDGATNPGKINPDEPRNVNFDER